MKKYKAYTYNTKDGICHIEWTSVRPRINWRRVWSDFDDWRVGKSLGRINYKKKIKQLVNKQIIGGELNPERRDEKA